MRVDINNGEVYFTDPCGQESVLIERKMYEAQFRLQWNSGKTAKKQGNDKEQQPTADKKQLTIHIKSALNYKV